MNSEIEKEPSDFEAPRAHVVGYALPKFDANEILPDQNEFPEFVPGSTDNNNQTIGAHEPVKIDVSEDEGTVRKGKNSRDIGHQKKRFICGVCGKSLSNKQSLQSHELTHT
ncbi:unnamed protein product, partial [Cyprideis torosa]